MTRPYPAPARARGFTLIELLVVVMIIGIIVALAGVQLMRSPGEAVRDESERLALLLRSAREEAIMQGRVFAFGAGRDSYRFLRLERDGKLKITKDDEILYPRQLPRGVAIESLQVEGVVPGDGSQPQGVVLLPSGDLPSFRILLAGSGARWTVVGNPDGTIRSEAGS
ncbi:MAG TPA: GspH/FimT family pseudopilin [Burkholderiales bacterium]|nr:GspH/FimT family pseudopilin [Burkholderiales bacterium]